MAKYEPWLVSYYGDALLNELQRFLAIIAHQGDAGDELSQGALAGGVFYFHGMTIAADTLSLDSRHRQSSEMTPTPLDGAMKTALVPQGGCSGIR